MGLAFAGVVSSAPVAQAAKKTTAVLNSSIPNAKSTFVGHESTCTADLATQRSIYGNTRQAVSSSNPYKYNNWISLRNAPATTTSSLYPAGNVSVPLQFNQYLFFCGAVVSPASGSATSSAANRVTNSQFPNDRNPVRTAGINRADLVQKDAKVVSATVVAGGGSITNLAGQTRYVRSTNDSRYAAGTTIPFTYTGNLQQTTTVKIKLVVREARSYYDVPTSGNATIICDHVNANGSIVGVSGFSSATQALNSGQCNRDIEKIYSIQIRVSPPVDWNLSVKSENRIKTSDGGSFGSYGEYPESSPRTVSPGYTVQWQHEIYNSGNAKAVFERWRDRKGFNSTNMNRYILQGEHIDATLVSRARVRYPLDSSNVVYKVTNSDIGKTLCERYVVSPFSNSSSGNRASTGSCVYVRPNWTTTGATQMRVNGVNKTGTEANPTPVSLGDKIEWQHTIKNNGPTNTHRAINVWVGTKDTSPSGVVSNNPKLWAKPAIASGFASGATHTIDTFSGSVGEYTIPTNDTSIIGKKMCRSIAWDPSTATDTNTSPAISTLRCVYVPYNFNLIPYLEGPAESITPGGTIPDVWPRVKNEVPTDPSKTTPTPNDIEWQLGRIDIPPGQVVPTGGTSGQNPQQFYGTRWDYKDGETNTSFPPGTLLLDLLKNEVVPIGTPLGTKICFTLSVRPYNATTTNWRHGEPLCIGVNAQPTVQVHGNDLRVGSAFQGGTNVSSLIQGVVRSDSASWGEYGVLSSNTINRFASQSGANGGSTDTAASWSKLSFANSGGGIVCGSLSGCFKGQSALGSIPNVRSAVTSIRYNGAPLSFNRGSSSFNTSSIPSFVSGANLSSFNQSAAVVTSGTITIDSDIIYRDNTLGNEGQIPQLILIGNNINIKGDVKRVDAWLIATGTINTCSDVATSALRSTVCNEQLRVNGALMANRLLMNRTYYDTNDGSKPAETFNLQGSAYVWASNVTRQNGMWQTVYSTDLPPRY